MPPTSEARFARDSEKALRVSSHPTRNFASPLPIGPTSNTRMVTPSSGPPLRMTDEAWARTMVGSPCVTMALGELKELHLDHRTGFILSLMDALIDLETLVDLSGMDRDEVLELVRGLYEAGVIIFR